MNKFLCSLGLSFSLITGAFAYDNSLDLLNAEITNILAQFQNPVTVAKLHFDAAEINSEHAVKLGLNAFYSKLGSNNTFQIKMDNLAYDYGDGTSPTTVIKGAIGLDFTKILTQQESNEMVPQAMEFLQETVKHYTEEYGESLSIKGVITSTTKDDQGNYTGLTALLSAKIDLDKLPGNMPRERVLVTEATFSISLNLKTGITMDAFIVSNPEYFAFQDNEFGLKEIIERLLNRDEDAIKMIESLFETFDVLASEIVEWDNSLFKNLYMGIKKHSLH